MSMELHPQEFIPYVQNLASFRDLGPLINKVKDKRIVMLGEASHGTKEFYEWRAAITKELVEHHGFSFVAVEGDWPACQKVQEYIHEFDAGSAYDVLMSFSRWPTWMWANAEMVELLEWMRTQRMGFHGLDVYSFFESMDEVVKILEAIDPNLASRARKFYSCFAPYDRDEKTYVHSLYKLTEGCQDEVTAVLQDLLMARLSLPTEYPYTLFDATQNALIVKNAERYYRAMISSDDNSWNIRDEHMLETLDNLLNFYGPNSKAIVWAHNTHIGDHRATDMVLSGEVNLGGLAREKYGNDSVGLVGFSTYSGEVIASHTWDGPITVLEVPPAKLGSWEDFLHQVGVVSGKRDFYLLIDEALRESGLSEYKGQRAIGVVYHPEREARGNYVPTSLANRYDALIFVDRTHALSPLKIPFDRAKIPETFPYPND